MTLRNLPEIQAARLPEPFAFEADADALQRWETGVRAASTDEATISILDVIGGDPWTGGGVTSKRISAALRQIGDQPVRVDINSPGGDFFEGVAIYNLLRQHPHQVTVRILGLAASAASVIAMAGDTIEIGTAGFLMVHNAWVMAVGNRHDLADVATTLETFDSAMASLYAARAGVDEAQATRWMDDETWFNGKQAIEAGLADAPLPADAATKAPKAEQSGSVNATRTVERLLAKAGISRKESRSLLGEIKGGTHDAAATVTHDAGEWMAAARQLIETIRS